MKEKIKGHLIPIAVTIPFAFIYYYLALPAINLRAIGFWAMLIITALVYIVSFAWGTKSDYWKEVFKKLEDSMSGKRKSAAGKKQTQRADDYVIEDTVGMPKWAKITLIVLASLAAVALLVCFFTSSKIFRAKRYQEMLTVTDSDFASDIAEIDIKQIPTVDRDTAERLGSRKIGEAVDLVSQFNVSSYYSQINFDNKPYRVTPLEYAGVLKWISNRADGIPYYVSIDTASQETELVKLDEGMKYSPSEYFARDLTRHLRFAYPTKMFENLSFEIDENKKPYWVMSYYEYTIGLLGGKDIAGIILVDAITGEMTDYPIDEVPQWIDIAYSAELLIEQADNWGSLEGGFLNSIFVQKNVVVTTDGYNYIAVDDDIWLYTGITSVVADESNIGFILINLRTKEAKKYMINGAEEYSAMESAQGQIQEKGYTATFPILLNVADRPSYFISLKDNAGLVKSYAFVDVANYQIVGVADSIDGAKSEYLRMLGITPSETPDITETDDYSGIILDIATAVVNGNSVYYLKVDDKIYTVDIAVSDILPFLKNGDSIDFSANKDGNIVKIDYST